VQNPLKIAGPNGHRTPANTLEYNDLGQTFTAGPGIALTVAVRTKVHLPVDSRSISSFLERVSNDAQS